MRLYESLCKIFNEVSNIDNIIALLKWDEQITMPIKAIQSRIDQINSLLIMKYDILGNATVTNLIQENIKQKFKFNQWQLSNLLHMERIHNNVKAIPIDLLCAFNNASISSKNMWRQARQENKFAIWLPYFEELINLSCQIASAKSEFLNCSKYEALLDDYEAGLKIDYLNAIFSKVGVFLRDIMQCITPNDNEVYTFEASFSLKKQKDLSREIMKLLKISSDQVRIDESSYSFNIGDVFDSRVSIQYHDKDFVKGINATLHECGYLLYNINLPIEYYKLPIGKVAGMVMHEAQALIFEKHIGSSLDFINCITPLIKRAFKVKGITTKNIYNIANHINLSCVRLGADEISYPIHIMIRYTLERALIEGNLKPRDLPQAWKEEMEHYLHMTPSNDNEGCMQDIHWAVGAFGCFPSYLLGAIAGAQIFAKIKSDIPEVMKKISHGNLECVINWLTDKIYKYGSRYTTQELFQESFGGHLDSKYYIEYLQAKYCP